MGDKREALGEAAHHLLPPSLETFSAPRVMQYALVYNAYISMPTVLSSHGTRRAPTRMMRHIARHDMVFAMISSEFIDPPKFSKTQPRIGCARCPCALDVRPLLMPLYSQKTYPCDLGGVTGRGPAPDEVCENEVYWRPYARYRAGQGRARSR